MEKIGLTGFFPHSEYRSERNSENKVSAFPFLTA